MRSAQPDHIRRPTTHSWLGWLSWSFQQVSLAPLPKRLLLLSVISLANVFVGACLYRSASGAPWGHALFKTYGVLFRAPGFGVTNEATVLATLVLNTIFILGLFVFAHFLSFISEEVKQQLHAIRMGEVNLPLRNHLVVLNWNQQSPSLLKQLGNAHSDPRNRLHQTPIVVLAPPSKAVMDASMAAFKGTHLHVFCCSGNPTKTADLERVAAQAADTVIILQPDSSSRATADALKLTALVSLTCLRSRTALAGCSSQTPTSGLVSKALLAVGRMACSLKASLLPGMGIMSQRLSDNMGSSGSSGQRDMRIVVQGAGSDDNLVSFLRGATSPSLYSGSIQQVQLPSQSTLDRLVCQTAAQPGVATVFRELVRAGADAQLAWCDVTDSLVGSYGQAPQVLQGAVLLGVLTESGSLTLNPPDHLMLSPGDRLVALTQQGFSSATWQAALHSPRQAFRRTISRVSSMASPQLGLDAKRSSSGGGGGSASGSHWLTSRDCATKEAVAASLASSLQPAHAKGLHIILLGWQESGVPDLLLQLQSLVPLGSSVTVVLPAAVGSTEQQPAKSASRTSSKKQEGATLVAQTVLRVAQPGSLQAMLEADIAQADAVIVGPALSSGAAAAVSTSEADALVTAAMLAIQQALQSTQGGQPAARAAGGHAEQAGAPHKSSDSWQPRSKLHVVAVVTSYSVRRALQTFLSSILLRCSFSYEIMVLDEFAAGMLALVAQELANALVIDQLLLQPSNGLTMWSLQKLGFDADPVDFQEVCQAARQQRATALGYRRADGRMVLAPLPGLVSLTSKDRVVVLDGSRKGHGHRQG